jgi:glutamate-1-semialdehyde 2,1-aminomutase
LHHAAATRLIGEDSVADVEAALVREYAAWTKRSAELVSEARRWFPGGDTRISAHFSPHPLVIDRGEGSRIFDADGHELIDFMNNFTSLVHGHAHPAVVEAVSEQVRRGTAYAAPARNQLELAQTICERVPSVEQLRFTSSGSEATLMALRCARAHTGRSRVMKLEGCYHGSYELAEISFFAVPGPAGPVERPRPVPIDASTSESAMRDAVIAPYNEPEIARRLIDEHAHELAAVILEPVLGSTGLVPATREFVQTLRDATAEHGIVLVFDEVITLRLGSGGVQSLLGIAPDLTAMGKIIGGGLPIGAIGGRRELLDLFSPDRPSPVVHASTFSGNPLSMAAGIAALRHFTPVERERIDALGARLREGFRRAFRCAGVRGQAIGAGSFANLHLTDRTLRSARDTLAGAIAAAPLPQLLHLSLLRRGIAGASRLMYCVSTPMGESEIDAASAALEESLAELRPAIAQHCPELLA